jgi:prophage antirepressor-like protein
MPNMPDPTQTEDTSTRFNRTVSETTERLEKEAQEFVKYLNDEVVPAVRQHSTKALRVAARKMQELADYMEEHSSSTK